LRVRESNNPASGWELDECGFSADN
jgi:hypothetical protein